MDHDFYYNREERLSNASTATKDAYIKRSHKNFFKRNPQLKILIIDLVLVLLFSTIIIPFFVRVTKDFRIEDYKVSSKAIIFEDTILVSIKLSKMYKKNSNEISENSITVDILKNSSIIKTKTDVFPTTMGEDKYITFKIPKQDYNLEYIEIKIKSGDFIKERKVQIEH